MGAIIIFAWCIVGGVLAAVLFNAGMHVAWIWTLGMVWGYILFFIMYHVTPRKFPTPKWIKAIWEHIWPAAKQKEPTEFPPQEELNSKLNEHLAWVKSMAGAYVFWEKDRYEVWREEGMFYIAIPNRFTGTTFCSPSAGGVLNMARGTLESERESILSNLQSMVNVADSLAKAWLHISGHLKPQPLSGDVSEQSVILPKMDYVIWRANAELLSIEYDNNKTPHNAHKFLVHLGVRGEDSQRINEDKLDLDLSDMYKYVGYNLYKANTFHGPSLVFENGEAYPLSYIKDKIKPEEFDKTLKRLFKKV